jgi:hypothetical protein
VTEDTKNKQQSSRVMTKIDVCCRGSGILRVVRIMKRTFGWAISDTAAIAHGPPFRSGSCWPFSFRRSRTSPEDVLIFVSRGCTTPLMGNGGLPN